MYYEMIMATFSSCFTEFRHFSNAIVVLLFSKESMQEPDAGGGDLQDSQQQEHAALAGGCGALVNRQLGCVAVACLFPQRESRCRLYGLT